MKKKLLLLLMVFTIIIGVALHPIKSWGDNGQVVYLIPVEGEITPAMATFFKNSIEDAKREKADAILVDLSTFGGRVDAAFDMKQAIEQCPIPIIVYISDRALSAGALLSIVAPRLIMAPGSHMGSAEPIPYSIKTVAAIRGEFEAAAERNGRDKIIAAAMVDKEIDIPGLSPAGALLDITAETAKEYGYAEELVEGRENLLNYLGFKDALIIENQPDLLVKLAQFLTQSHIASLLLTIGIIAIIIEIFTQGFGISGIIGLSSLTLYFGANLIAGYSQWWPALVFLTGIGLLIVEVFIPGFGIPGISGIAAVLVGIVFAAPDPIRGIKNLGTAFVLIIIILPILFYYLKRFNAFKSFVLSDTVVGRSEQGQDDRNQFSNKGLLGKKGIVVTTLRPSGVISIDGKRMDAISQGEFLIPGTPVRVMEDKGLSVVVSKDDSQAF